MEKFTIKDVVERMNAVKTTLKKYVRAKQESTNLPFADPLVAMSTTAITVEDFYFHG